MIIKKTNVIMETKHSGKEIRKGCSRINSVNKISGLLYSIKISVKFGRICVSFLGY